MKITICKICAKIYFFIGSIVNTFRLSLNNVHIGTAQINGFLKISNSTGGIIKIGNGTIINSSWYANKSGGGADRTCLVTENNGKILIGDHVGISNSTIYSRISITIEENVLIGVNCTIYDNDFHSTDANARQNGNRCIKAEPVVIKRGAWIGGHCIILKGVTIGENSVVGAGSVVTHSVPDNELWAGNPARFIKRI